MMRILAILFFLAAATPAQAAHGGKHVFVTINGLVCDFCARAMEKTFSKRAEVSGIAVDLTSKVVTINLKNDASLGDDDIRKGVIDAGYNVVDIKRD